ncbi:hypothetical protein GCM10009118_07770 [Wandonia haliotis]|uniref:Cytochrome c domain-containing protein n=1 Tax=Wandonia haliotis TaxID=574963 RepID=A0ABP3XY45_9FLAO
MIKQDGYMLRILVYTIVLLFVQSCSKKQATVREYLEKGDYPHYKKIINDTILFHRDHSFVLRDRLRNREVTCYSKLWIEQNPTFEFEAHDNTQRLAQGKYIFSTYCIQCHSDFEIKNRIENIKISIDAIGSLFESSRPKIEQINGVFYYEIQPDKKHSKYYIINPYDKQVLIEYLNCLKESTDGGCLIVLSENV